MSQRFSIPRFRLPALVASIGTHLPQWPHSLALATALNAAARMGLLPDDSLAQLEGRSFLVEVLDAGGQASFTYRAGRFRPLLKAPETPDLSFSANLSAFLQLLARQEDPDTLFFSMYHSSAPRTWQSPENLKDAQVDAAIEKGREAADPAEREAAYKELNARLMEIAPSIYAYDLQSVFAASTRVKAPALTGDPAKAFNLAGMGFTFRLMEVAD